MLIALCITGSVLAIEAIGAALLDSLALLVDAAHMLTDTLGLAMAATAATLMSRPPSARHTWGLKRAEVIASAAQAFILLLVGGYAVYEGLMRLIDPPPVSSHGLAVIGLLGLLANFASLLVLLGGRDSNLNMKAAFLEVANDALGSVAVLLAGVLLYFTGWTLADSIAGLFVAALIVPRAVALLRESGSILLESTPDGLDLEAVRAHILEQPHVREVHDLHASTVATGLPRLSAHVVLDDDCFFNGHSQRVLMNLSMCLNSHHGIAVEHCTFQLEAASVAGGHAEHVH
ncbi:cation diffusion facilitator family transporter [Dermatophilus congolensis]|uniref:cation diffusion facilitator family transporter n=1 Tax=Dermatophilus congolensis TaxID=1863 RepID=UPI000685D7AE|nr:cation diffusion facilitator family transporter [Dermatophilus congolensis]